MSIRGRVSAYIKSHPGKRFCDTCIQEQVGVANSGMTNEATRRLSKGGIILGFIRSEGVCDLCGERRLVICAPYSNSPEGAG
jgi:hypothetical protein